MPAFLLPLLLRFMSEKAARLVATLLPIVVGLLLVLFAYLWAYDRGKHSQDALIVKLNASVAQSTAAVGTLTQALDTQNAEVAALKSEGDKRAADARTARDAADKANLSLSTLADRLRDSAGHKRESMEPCATSDLLKGAKDL